nr:hypothetical protein [Tanacetum cinerariifolium]
PQPRVPRRSVAHADVQQIEFRVVGHGVPDGTAAALLDELVAKPGFAGDLHGLVFRRQFRITRHGKEPPVLLAGVRIVSGDVTAHPVFGAAVADDHLALHHARRASDGDGAVRAGPG